MPITKPKTAASPAPSSRPLTSKRSGGPRTAEGWARSSLNAIKHGVYVTASSAAQEFQATFSELAHALEYPWTKTQPEELSNPPKLKALRARIGSYLAMQLGSLLSQSGLTADTAGRGQGPRSHQTKGAA